MKAFRLAVLATALCIAAQADLFDYTEQQIGSGSLGGASFTNALVTIVLTADTSGITTGSNPAVLINNGVATVTVAGIAGVATFSGISDVVDNRNGAVGIDNGSSAVGFNPDILDTVSPIFSTYGLATPIGPVTASALGNPFTGFETSSGEFILSSSDSGTSTFTAGPANAATPEPASYIPIIASALVVLSFIRHRRVASRLR